MWAVEVPRDQPLADSQHRGIAVGVLALKRKNMTVSRVLLSSSTLYTFLNEVENGHLVSIKPQKF